MARKKAKKRNCTNDMYSVVQFNEKGAKLFECIWDGWFVDENRDSCFWPPKGKSYLLRVLSKEKPDDSWKICKCVVISEGHVTYNSGFDYVKEKCAQKFNTSSADEQQEALRQRRKHPALASMKSESFEHVFKNDKHKLKAKAIRQKQGASKENLRSKRSRSEKEGKCSQNNTIMKNDINGADKKLTDDNDLASTSSPRSPDSSQRSCSRSRSISMSRWGSGISQKALSNTEATNQSFVRPRSQCSTKEPTSPFLNRSCSPKPRSRSRSSNRRESIYSRSSNYSRRSRSNSRRSSRSNNSQRSRSNSRSRSQSRSCFSARRSRSKSSSRPRSNSSKSDVAAGLHSPQRCNHSCSKSSSVLRSTSPTTDQLGTKASPPSSSLNFMQLQLKELRIIAKQNHHRIAVNDRRLARMEVSMNKVLVTMTDLKHAIISKNMLTGDAAPIAKSKEIPKGFKNPDLPLVKLEQLVKLNRNLRDREFRVFLLTQEKYYCSASRQSDTVIMTAYLKRFITLELRDTLHLKDAKGKDEPTLIHDFPQVYKFLIDVMVTGYQDSNTQLKASDAHIALRTVWSRTKQMLREQKNI